MRAQRETVLQASSDAVSLSLFRRASALGDLRKAGSVSQGGKHMGDRKHGADTVSQSGEARRISKTFSDEARAVFRRVLTLLRPPLRRRRPRPAAARPQASCAR